MNGLDLVSSSCAAPRFLFLAQQNHSNAIKANATTPATTPPAIAAVDVPPELASTLDDALAPTTLTVDKDDCEDEADVLDEEVGAEDEVVLASGTISIIREAAYKLAEIFT